MWKWDEFDDMAARYRALTKTVKEQPAYGCKEDCLNGAYRAKRAAADAGVAGGG